MPFHPLRVAAIDRLCADAVAVTFEVPASLSAAFRFSPGQSLTVHRDGERRTYSICAPVGSAPRIGVREVPGGLISRWMVHDLRVGDLVEVAPPSGTFTPDLAAGGHHVLIAAGSGITPVLSIAASLLEGVTAGPSRAGGWLDRAAPHLRSPVPAGLAGSSSASPAAGLPGSVSDGARVTLFYGNRRADTVMFAEELADLKDRYPDRLELVHVLSREARESELFSGRLDAARLRELVPLLTDVEAVDHWWLCGPFGMVTDATTVLGELGVPAGRVHRELFWVDEAPPPPVRPEALVDGPICEVTVVLDGRKTTVPVPEGVTLLDGAQKSRPDLPFACKGGVCGTCRARVTDGAVTMRRNFALEEAEVEAGFVLTCQSLPAAAKVVVDFDQ
ncbi:phenylacetate-CoA oxygenase/reductase subunit PaaK [Actinoplanes sichuanensis]|uniref:2Fe-2S iron-sulfur cluster-binding protein n=1 Tax=Actinoplanes sichuanensis TaxID=512349 RepID=A0ABW4ASU9_9ACTN|nr:2Fe-2S iron-sulfur cluster-binding protein [Actinoplanes sichuanensis]BEL07262.1 phenylacetate-CoA oxygenase/reductase subunit PaaK [Actinoplanes sichuanensis]